MVRCWSTSPPSPSSPFCSKYGGGGELRSARSDQSAVLERRDKRGSGVPIMVMIMLMASRRVVRGQFTLTPWLTILGWLASGVMAAAAVGMFATWGS